MNICIGDTVYYKDWLFGYLEAIVIGINDNKVVLSIPVAPGRISITKDKVYLSE